MFSVVKAFVCLSFIYIYLLSLYAYTYITASALLRLVFTCISLFITELICELEPYDILLQKIKIGKYP
jgi:hypothetical protein